MWVSKLISRTTHSHPSLITLSHTTQLVESRDDDMTTPSRIACASSLLSVVVRCFLAFGLCPLSEHAITIGYRCEVHQQQAIHTCKPMYRNVVLCCVLHPHITAHYDPLWYEYTLETERRTKRRNFLINCLITYRADRLLYILLRTGEGGVWFEWESFTSSIKPSSSC